MKQLVLLGVMTVATGCVDDGLVREVNGKFSFGDDREELFSPGLAGRDVVAIGDILYVVTARQLRMVVGSIDLGFEQPFGIELQPAGPADAYGLVAGDGVLYVGDRFGVTVLDLAMPLAPAIVARVEVAAGIRKLARHAGTLIALTHDRELVVLDIANARLPRVVGSLPLAGGEGPMLTLEVDASGAVIGARGALWFVDLARPDAPRLIADHELGLVGSFARKGNLLYTGNDDASSVLDIADPQNPRPVGPDNAPWRLGGAAPVIDGDRLYMAQYEDGDIYVLDIGSPTRPELVRALISDSETIPDGFVHDMTFANRQIWQTHRGGMFSWVIDF